AIKADEESANAPAAAASTSADAGASAQASYQSSSSDEGTLASDEALAALRAKLTGNWSSDPFRRTARSPQRGPGRSPSRGHGGAVGSGDTVMAHREMIRHERAGSGTLVS